MHSIQKMTVLRDLASAFPNTVNQHFPNEVEWKYARLFLHHNVGFGFYPRFKNWSDLEVEGRTAVFRNAIFGVEKSWHGFLSLWSDFTGNTALAADLTRNLSTTHAGDLYQKVLTVMLNTPAAWSERVISQAYEMIPACVPCVAEYVKENEDSPWQTRILCKVDGQLKLVQSGLVERGYLLGCLDQFAPIF